MRTLKTLAMIAAAVSISTIADGASARTIIPHDHHHDAHPESGAFQLYGQKWGDPEMGTGAEITYSFKPSGLDINWTDKSVGLSEFLPSGYKSEIALAFDAWASVANLTFTEVEDPGVGWFGEGAEASDIRITGAVLESNIIARANYPIDYIGAVAGDIRLNSTLRWKTGFAGSGFDIFQVVAHEIGHAIGLKHECGNNGRDRPCNKALMNPYYSQSFRGLLADDIDGAQAIYGANIPDVQSVPLPASLPMLGGVLALFGAISRYRKRRTVRAAAI